VIEQVKGCNGHTPLTLVTADAGNVAVAELVLNKLPEEMCTGWPLSLATTSGHYY
jgi:hypothetical protein